MNHAPSPDDGLNELFAAARRAQPNVARVELAFETRLLARLRSERRETVGVWAWRLAPFFAIISLAVAWWGDALELREPLGALWAEPGSLVSGASTELFQDTITW